MNLANAYLSPPQIVAILVLPGINFDERFNETAHNQPKLNNRIVFSKFDDSVPPENTIEFCVIFDSELFPKEIKGPFVPVLSLLKILFDAMIVDTDENTAPLLPTATLSDNITVAAVA
jgi:hypothetical protein